MCAIIKTEAEKPKASAYKPPPFFIRWLALIVLFSSSFLHAERYVLFSVPGQQVEGYDEIVGKVGAGDVLVFSDGKEFTIKKKLGSGNTTAIFEVAGDLALRIPLRAGNFHQGLSWESVLDARDHGAIFLPYTFYITAFIKGQKLLSEHAVKVVKMDRYLEAEYAVVEEVAALFTLKSYLEESRGLMPEGRRNNIDSELIEWIKSAALLSEIGDFHREQLLYTDEGWKLIDFTGDVRASVSQRDTSLFVLSFWDRVLSVMGRHNGLSLPSDLIERAKAAIQEVRKAEGLPFTLSSVQWCGKALGFLSNMVKNDRQRQRALK